MCAQAISGPATAVMQTHTHTLTTREFTSTVHRIGMHERKLYYRFGVKIY